MDCNPPGSFAMGCPRQEYCSGLPFHSLRDLPDPGIEPISPLWQTDSSPLSHQGVCVCVCVCVYIYLFKIYEFMVTSLVVQWIRLYSQ